MRNTKSKKSIIKQLKVNDYLIIILIFVIIVNIITRLTANEKNLIKYQFALIEENINGYKSSVNSNIIEKLTVLTNVLNTTTIVSNIYPHIIKKLQNNNFGKLSNKFSNSFNTNNSLSFDSFNNKINYVVDNVFSIKDKFYIQIGNFYYKEGDTLNGKNIDSISPSFVVIGGQYYPIAKDNKK